jgi:hypothetical protein
MLEEIRGTGQHGMCQYIPVEENSKIAEGSDGFGMDDGVGVPAPMCQNGTRDFRTVSADVHLQGCFLAPALTRPTIRHRRVQKAGRQSQLPTPNSQLPRREDRESWVKFGEPAGCSDFHPDCSSVAPWELGVGSWKLRLEELGFQPARFWLRNTASAHIARPQAASAAACGQSRSSPIPFRKIPRTITRK